MRNKQTRIDEKDEIKRLVNRAIKLKESIAESRDKLRDLLSDFNIILESTDVGLDLIDEGICKISEYV